MAPGLLVIVAICHLLAAVGAADEGNWGLAVLLASFFVGDGALVYMAMNK